MKPQRIQAALRCVLAWCCCAGSSVSAESGLDAEVEFDIPAGPLAATLVEIGKSAGIIVSYRPEAVQTQQAPAIRGRLTPRQAVAQALRPHGLSMGILTGGGVTVLEAPPALPPPELPRPDPLAAVMAKPGQAVLPPVVVFGSGPVRQSDGLRALRGWSATRTDTPLEDLPQAMGVLTGEALALQGENKSSEALRYIPGVTLQMNTTGLRIESSVVLRGLPAQYTLSGMRTVRSALAIDTAFTERIEIPKGPSSVMGGVTDKNGNGGVVNLLRKQAGPGVQAEASQSIDSRDNGTLRASADIGGVWSTHRYWRLTSYGYQSGTTEGGYRGQGGAGLLGSVSHQEGDFTAVLTFQADKTRSVPPPASRGGAIIEPRRPIQIVPVEEGIRPADDPNDRSRVGYAGADVEAGGLLAPGWRVSLKARTESLHNDERRYDVRTNFVKHFLTDVHSIGLQGGLTGEVETGPITHALLLGVDVDRRRTTTVNDRSSGFRPVVAQQVLRQAGVLLQDQLSLGPWRVRGAVQRTRAPSVERLDAFGATTNWDLGALYRWTPSAATYLGVQRSQSANKEREQLGFPDGTHAPFREVRQVQAGARFGLAEGRMDLTMEAYRLRQENVASPNFRDPTYYPGRTVRGLDVTLAGRPLPAWQIDLGLGLMRARDLVLSSVKPGQEPVYVPAAGLPARTLSLLTRYDLSGSEDHGTRLGLGLRAYSSSVSIGFFSNDMTNQIHLPGGTQVDLSVSHRRAAWTLSAHLTNALDRQLYATQGQFDFVALQPSRGLRLTAVYSP